MKINEMLLVIENTKGKETGYLSSFEDYMEVIHTSCKDNIADMAFATAELFQKKEEWHELYLTSSRSYYAKFCKGEPELRGFLLGFYEREKGKSITIDKELFSVPCNEVLATYGMDLNGKSIYPLHYEHFEHTFSVGEIFQNINGNKYRVLSVIDQSPSSAALLVMAQNDGQLIVADRAAYYARSPKEECHSEDCIIKGVEWGSGTYLGYDITKLDYDQIQRVYGKTQEIVTLSDYHQMLEKNFRGYSNLVQSENFSQLMKDTMIEHLYTYFRTSNLETFLEQLKEGEYDASFTGISQKQEKEKLR